MRERVRVRKRGLYIQMPGIITASFLERIGGEPNELHGNELPTKMLEVNGAQLHYFEFGDGEPVVFVHGSIGDYRTWGYQFEAFAQRYRIISYSRRYHWPNAWTGDGRDYSTRLHADDLAAFIRALGHGPAHVVGQSTGAIICALCASFHPDTVKTLIVDEPDFQHWGPDIEGCQALLDELNRTVTQPACEALAAGDVNGCMRIFCNGYGGPGLFDALTPEMRQVMLDNAPSLRAELSAIEYNSPFSYEDVARIEAPTLLLEGSVSLPALRLLCERFAQYVPDLERVLAKDAPHAAHFATPEEFNRLVLAFLDRHSDKVSGHHLAAKSTS